MVKRFIDNGRQPPGDRNGGIRAVGQVGRRQRHFQFQTGGREIVGVAAQELAVSGGAFAVDRTLHVIAVEIVAGGQTERGIGGIADGGLDIDDGARTVGPAGKFQVAGVAFIDPLHQNVPGSDRIVGIDARLQFLGQLFS